MDEPYIGLLAQDQLDDFAKLIGEYSALSGLFGDGWLTSIAHVGMDSKSVHPLFWELANPIVNRHHAEALLRLKAESPSCGKFVAELKAAQNRGEVMGSLREVDTYYALRSRNIDVEWKPTKRIGDKTYKPDLFIKTEPPIYLEILAITDSAADLREEEAHNQLVIGINKLKNNPYYISTGIRTILTEEYVASALAFFETILPSVHLENEDASERHMFKIDGQDIIRFEFYHAPEGRGQWIGGGGPSRSIDPSSRIKNKLLDKIEALQLPPKEKDEHMNGYLLFLETMLSSNYGVMAALKGQQTLSFPLPGEPGPQAVPGHAPNGIVHHATWDEAINKNIDFVASTKPDRKGILLGEQSYVAVAVGREGEAERIWGLLFDGPPKPRDE